MSRNERPERPRAQIVPMLALVAIASACVAESPTQPAASPEFGQVAGGPGVMASVRGGGHYQLAEPPAFVGDFKWVYRFSFNVEKRADGTDAGTVRFLSRTPKGQNNVGFPGDWWAVAEIDCVEVDGNIAWMSGTIVEARTDSPFGPGVGSTPLFIVQDNGATGPDVVNVGPAGAFGVTDCRERPTIFPGAWVDGNVTVAVRP